MTYASRFVLLMAGVLAQGYGISSQASYQEANPARMAACHAVH